MSVFAFVLGVACGLALMWGWLRARWARQAQDSSQYQADAAEASDRLTELSTLTGGLAHEIRNPLSTLKVNLQLLGENWRDATEVAESDLCRRSLAKIETLRTEADRLQEILDEFLHYIGRQEFHRAPTDLNELVDDVLVFFRPQAAAQRVQVLATLWREPLVCEVDVDKIKQALLNLFVNAQQAMPDGGELMVRTSREAGSQASETASNAVLEVIDTGCGVRANEVDKIFQPYYSTKPEGTGLGLPTTRRMVRAHGGTIEVHGEPGRGSRFVIRLPLVEPEEPSQTHLE